MIPRLPWCSAYDRQFGKSTSTAAGHRIVHDGVELTESVVLDDRKTASLH